VGRGHRKGSSFERKICKKLSLWWTGSERDDVFWRTAGSGARAKVRSKKGKGTFGQYGDIQAVDPIGQPLLDVCSIELKIGYGKYSILDILDKPTKTVKQQFEDFLEQANDDRKNAGVEWVMLITKRDRRVPIITISSSLYRILRHYVWFDDTSILFLQYKKEDSYYSIPLDDFLHTVPASFFKEKYWEDFKKFD